MTFKFFYIFHTVVPSYFIRNNVTAIGIKEAMISHLLQSATNFLSDITKLHCNCYVGNANFTFLQSWTRITTLWPWRCWYAFLAQCLAGKKEGHCNSLVFEVWTSVLLFAHLLATVGKHKILNQGELVECKYSWWSTWGDFS